MIITVTLKDIENGYPKAYENIARKAGIEVNDKTRFDCRYIEVSKEIDDYFWKYYEDVAYEKNPNADSGDVQMSISMLMLQYGAKRNEDLKPWTVEIEDGFAKE